MKTKHTAIPWQRIQSAGGYQTVVASDPENPVGTAIAFTVIRGDRQDADVAEANAAFIVKAVNSHDELLEALKSLVNCPVIHGLSAHIRDEARHHGRENELTKAIAAIAKAEGK